MPGTVQGGKETARVNKEKYGEDYYARIGALGGRKSRTGGFYHAMITGQDWHIKAGRKGGLKSRRGKANG